MSTLKYEKLYTALKYYLIGRGFSKALEALELGKTHHVGLRKDKVTPEFQHQIEIALHVSTLKNLDDEESTIIVALLHDLVEDYNYEVWLIENKFGKVVSQAVEAITKKSSTYVKNYDQYFHEMSNDRIASIVKGCDRSHNFSSMVGVFSIDKQKSYVDEGTKHFLPMLKVASEKFPSQFLAYANIRHMIKTQIAMISATFTK